jgi:2-polyprenyl-3-methyl-5-hydroxy-6-metoxy-1,4-benzoquinol methylase
VAKANYVYVGSELDTFKHARNWKRYWSEVLAPYVGGTVLEVGGGAGANIPYLLNRRVTRLVSLEPDAWLAEQLEAAGHTLRTKEAAVIQARHGTLSDLPTDERFDTIVYVDVLEHIEPDCAELLAAANRLTPDGHLLVLAPAFQSLYSDFDRAIGHYRRYTIDSLKALTPRDTIVVHARYLDAVGACLSAANRLILSRPAPTRRNILFWDRCVVPISRIADRLLGRFAGRSVVCVWRKTCKLPVTHTSRAGRAAAAASQRLT